MKIILCPQLLIKWLINLLVKFGNVILFNKLHPLLLDYHSKKSYLYQDHLIPSSIFFIFVFNKIPKQCTLLNNLFVRLAMIEWLFRHQIFLHFDGIFFLTNCFFNSKDLNLRWESWVLNHRLRETILYLRNA